MSLHKIFHIILLCPVFIHAQDDLSKVSSLYASGNYIAALSHVNVYLDIIPDDPDGLKLRADCNQKLEHLDKALEDYDKARINGYKGDDLYLNRGICKISLGQMDAAKMDLSSFINKNPEDARGYYWMASIEYLNLDNKASLRYIDEALYLDSTYSDAYFLRAANYVEQKKNSSAMDDFQIAYGLNPKLYRAKLNMAVLFLDMGQYDEALETLSELKLEDIDFISEVLYYRGETHFRMHDLDGACIDWSEASKYGDTDAQANHQRLCMNHQGKPKFKRRSYGQF